MLFRSEVEAPDDNFTVEIDPLQKSSLGRDLLEARRRHAEYGKWLDAAQLDGTLPPGALGASSLQDVVEEVGHLEASALGWGIDLTSATEERVGFDLPVDEWIGSTSTSHSLRLEGSIGGIVQREGQLLATDIRFARPKPSHRLALVVRLAALQHAQPDVPWTEIGRAHV